MLTANIMRERDQLRRILELAAAQSATKKIGSAEDFVALLKNRSLAGPQQLSSDAESVITGYVNANLAKGELLEMYITKIFAAIPDSEFDKPIHPETDITLGTALNMAYYAISKWPAINNDKKPIANLPLAV